MGGTILFVEDHLFSAKLTIHLLEQRMSYHLWWVQTGLEAEQVTETMNPVLFLLDYRLPDCTGLQLADRLHALAGRETIPILLLSADLPDKDLEEQLHVRQIIGMRKPFVPEELVKIISLLVQAHTSTW
ncbi:MAG TPA: response regulator [Ktedonobacteraceae bacterium]|nr:response regulator [Ktedonobacteraceae bacterium]